MSKVKEYLGQRSDNVLSILAHSLKLYYLGQHWSTYFCFVFQDQVGNQKCI